MFDSIATLAVAANMRELYRLVLVDTPLAPYFSENLTHEDLDEMNIEVCVALGKRWSAVGCGCSCKAGRLIDVGTLYAADHARHALQGLGRSEMCT